MEADVWFEPELVIEVVASEITLVQFTKQQETKSEKVQDLH